MLSPEGRCKTLDASADGYVRAEAVGALMLRALMQAEAERGRSGRAASAALAVLAGSAINQDGRSSALTAPNGPAQQVAVRLALSAAELVAGAVGVLQLHGTGKHISACGSHTQRVIYSYLTRSEIVSRILHRYPPGRSH